MTNFLLFVFKGLAEKMKINENILSRFGISNVLYSIGEEKKKYKGVEQCF